MKKITNIILIIIIFVCFGKVSFKYYQYYKDSKVYSTIQNFKPFVNTNNDIGSKDRNKEYKSKEEELLSINDDYKMWITIDNTNIDYPVVQYIDNNFYLNHDFNKEKNISGTLFIDSNNDIDVDKNMIIYGHHMKNKTMFHNLNYFKKENFFNKNKINIIREGKEYIYEPFSAYVISKDKAIFNMSFSNDDEYKGYIEDLSNKSYFNRDINLDKDSEIVTLITCSYEYNGARTVVHGIRYK